MQREEAIELICSSGLSRHASKIIKYLLPSARLIVSEISNGKAEGTINSHLGGLPSLPLNADWPRWDRREYLSAEVTSLEKQLKAFTRATKEHPDSYPELRHKKLIEYRDEIAKRQAEMSSGPFPLAFLGQLFLSEICGVAPLPGWPQQGSLAFFYDLSEPWGFSPVDRGHCRVVFMPEDAPIAQAEFPYELKDEGPYPKMSVKAQCEWTLPTYLKLKIDNVPLLDDRRIQ